MPEKKFSLKEKNIFDHSECMVCLAGFEFREIVRKIEICKHIFHPKCLMMWLQREESCPLCKTGLSLPECLSSNVVFEDELENIDKACKNQQKNSKLKTHKRDISANLSDYRDIYNERLDTNGPQNELTNTVINITLNNRRRLRQPAGNMSRRNNNLLARQSENNNNLMQYSTNRNS